MEIYSAHVCNWISGVVPSKFSCKPLMVKCWIAPFPGDSFCHSRFFEGCRFVVNFNKDISGNSVIIRLYCDENT